MEFHTVTRHVLFPECLLAEASLRRPSGSFLVEKPCLEDTYTAGQQRAVTDLLSPNASGKKHWQSSAYIRKAKDVNASP